MNNLSKLPLGIQEKTISILEKFTFLDFLF